MTSLQGKITTTYDKLVEVFGEPTMTDASPYEKVNAQWMLEFKVPFVDPEYGDDFDYVKEKSDTWEILFEELLVWIDKGEVVNARF